MSSYYYKGKRHTKKNTAWKTIKKAARHFGGAIQGKRSGAEALVQRMIREYPGQPSPRQAPPAPPPLAPHTSPVDPEQTAEHSFDPWAGKDK